MELETLFCYNGPGELLRNKRFILTIIVLIVVCAGLAILARTPLLLRSVAVLSAPLFGYDLNAESFFFSPLIKADFKGLTIADTRSKKFLFTSSQLTVNTTPKGVLKGDVEKVLLKDAKIRIRLGDKKETETDLSFIKNIPSVRLLTMENGEFTLLFKGAATQISLKKIELTVKDFSPEHGGTLSFTGFVSINEPGRSELSATGKCKGTLQLTGIFPDMLGKGIVELDIEAFTAGKISMKGMRFTMPVQFEKDQIKFLQSNIGIEEFMLMENGQKAVLKKSFIGINARYQTKTGNLASDNTRIVIPGVGSLNGSARLTLKGAMPINASLETKELNFSNLFSMAKSLMTQEEAKKWSIQGEGSLKGRLAGTLSGKSPSLSGSVTMDIKKGGFTSPDGSKAAQGINGLVIMNFTLPRGEKDASLKVSSRISSGEYLWGRYYKDLSKDRARFSTDADILTNSKAGSRFKGVCDLFNTGRYVYDGHFDKNGWQFHINAQDMAIKRIVSDFLSNYLAEATPSLKGIDTDGKLSADISMTSVDKKLAARGNVKLLAASLKLPAVSLDVKSLDMDIPFDLTAKGGVESGPKGDGPNLGWITIFGFRKGEYTLPELKIPVTASGSDITATGVISVPFYGGAVRVRDLAARDVLGTSPRLSFAGSVSGIDLPRLLNDLTGLTFPVP
ncbi:MAG: putative rane protein [Deltaproteobacteria bacterium]|nr:putative rane protein [Deltaproteobacteria bacterium]